MKRTTFGAMVAILMAATFVGGCPDKPPVGPTPVTPTVSLTCNTQANGCSVDLWTKPVIGVTSSNVSSCVFKRNGETLPDWGTGTSSTRELEAQMASGSAVYSAECSGSAGTAQSSVTVSVRPGSPAAFQITDGVTGTPVSATVFTPVSEFDARGGTLNIIEAPARFNVAINAAGYQSHETVATSGRVDYRLWPTAGAGTDAIYIKQAVFGDKSAAAYNPGLHGMIKLAHPSLTVILPDELYDNPAVLAAHRQAYEQDLVKASGRQVSAQVVRDSSKPSLVGTVPVYISIDASIHASGQATLDVKNNLIRSVEVKHDGWESARGATVVHEAGHVFGLDHHNTRGVVGAEGFSLVDPFSSFEKVQMLMMIIRPAGTSWPDNDRAIMGARAGGFTGKIVFVD